MFTGTQEEEEGGGASSSFQPSVERYKYVTHMMASYISSGFNSFHEPLVMSSLEEKDRSLLSIPATQQYLNKVNPGSWSVGDDYCF